MDIEESELRALAALLRRLVDPKTKLTLRTRADIDVHARILVRVLDGLAAEAPSRQPFAAATEIERWSGSEANRPAGPQGLQHAVVATGGTACGIPRRALVVWQQPFHEGRLDSCPDCVAALQLLGGS